MLKISSVNPDHVVNWVFLMGLTNVDFTRENSATSRKFTRSDFVSFFLMMTDIFGEVTWNCLKFEGSFRSNLSCLNCLCTKRVHSLVVTTSSKPLDKLMKASLTGDVM